MLPDAVNCYVNFICLDVCIVNVYQVFLCFCFCVETYAFNTCWFLLRVIAVLFGSKGWLKSFSSDGERIQRCGSRSGRMALCLVTWIFNPRDFCCVSKYSINMLL